MPIVKIRNQPIDVDVEAELRQFNWTRQRWTADKLIAASPFRHDHTPSFFVRLDGEYAGCWSDSGAFDADWGSGGFVKLLSFLRAETWEETEEYLLAIYGRMFDDQGKIVLTVPKLRTRKAQAYLDHRLLDGYTLNSFYLESRGISAAVQQAADIRYDARSKAVVIPWFDANKRLCNVKYRTTQGKLFWYHRGAVPIRELVYGIDRVRGEVAVLEEGEIDALSWAMVGVQGIATGGANLTDMQADVIKRSPIRTLYVSGDNDQAGQKFAKLVEAKLNGYIQLIHLIKPPQWKDTNEALVNGYNLHLLVNKSVNVDKLRFNSSKFSSYNLK